MCGVLAWVLVATGMWLTAPVATASAQSRERELRFDPIPTLVVDVPLIAGLALVGLAADSPERCDACVPGSVDLALSETLGVPRGRGALAVVSDIGLYGSWTGGLALAFVGGYLGAGGGGHSLRRGGEDLWIVLEAGVATGLVTHVAKLAFARQRPDAYLGLEFGSRRNESFFSGHASQTAAIATSSSVVAFMRDYPFRWGVLASGAGLTAAVGMLRVLALKHWVSDVLVGWVVGIAIGLALPTLLHPREPAEPSVTEQPATLTLPVLQF